MSGSNNIAITISASDRASQKIDAVTKHIAAMRAPTDRVVKSIGRFSDTAGITALGKRMRTVAQHSLQVFENVGRIVGPLGAITGAASVAGMAKLASEWANYGSQLGFAAQRAGMTGESLQSLRGAAQLAGSSAQSLSSGMTALNDNLVNAAAGRAPQAVAAFGYLGVAFRDVNGHSRNVAQALPELADKIAGIKDPSIQAQIATMLFGGAAEDMLPLLRQGSAGIAQLSAAAQRYNPVSQEMIDASNRLRISQTELTLSVAGLGNSIAQALEPVMTPLLHDMAEWIAGVAGGLGRIIKGAADAAQSIGALRRVATVAEAAGEGGAAGGAGLLGSLGLGAAGLGSDYVYNKDMAYQRQSGDIGFNSRTPEGRAARAAGTTSGTPAPASFNARDPAQRAARASASGSSPAAPVSGKDAFVAQYMPKAIEESKKTGVDPRIILAQAGLETGWGAHAPQNNYFGIKGAGGTETTQEFVNGKMVTTQANFAGYQSPDASFDAYADFINKNPRYAAMKSAHGLDAQTAALGASGYATDPDYASKIKGIASGLNVPAPPAPRHRRRHRRLSCGSRNQIDRRRHPGHQPRRLPAWDQHQG